MVTAFKEFFIELDLQLDHGMGKSGLRDMNALYRPADIAKPGNGNSGEEMPEIEVMATGHDG